MVSKQSELPALVKAVCQGQGDSIAAHDDLLNISSKTVYFGGVGVTLSFLLLLGKLLEVHSYEIY